MIVRTPTTSLAVLALAAAAARCGGMSTPTAPSQPQFPVVAESLNYRYHYGTGDSVDSTWQETYHAWATARLGVQLPQKIEYYKYVNRQAMGERTGNYNTNGFAEPTRFEIHTLWPTDNHEAVHIYTALIGRPSDFFNEGIAVAFQTNPATGTFASVFNGQEVHQACSEYLRLGTLLGLNRMVTTTDFRAVTDTVHSYREAGSFVRFAIDRYDLARMLDFFRTSNRSDDSAAIRSRFLAATGATLENASRSG